MSVTQTDDIATCQMLRYTVFTGEQGVAPDIDVDGNDEGAAHFLCSLGGVPVGTARVLPKNEDAKIGRVCVLRAHRGKGLGQALVLAAVAWAREAGLRRAILGAQVDAILFYKALGFEPFDKVFLDADIEHQMMSLAL